MQSALAWSLRSDRDKTADWYDGSALTWQASRVRLGVRSGDRVAALDAQRVDDDRCARQPDGGHRQRHRQRGHGHGGAPVGMQLPRVNRVCEASRQDHPGDDGEDCGDQPARVIVTGWLVVLGSVFAEPGEGVG